MKRSSTNPGHGEPATEPATATGTGSGTVRAARFDRPLRHGAGRSFGDAEVDRQVQAAIEQGRQQGRAAGYAAGWAQGRQAAAEQAEQAARVREAAEVSRRAQDTMRLQALFAELSRLTGELDRALSPAWDEVADAVTDGALRIARAALGRELADLDQARLNTVRTALRTIGDPGHAVVRVHPDDQALLTSALTATSTSPLPTGVRLVADPALVPGEVRVATPTQRLRMHLPDALAAAEEVLRG